MTGFHNIPSKVKTAPPEFAVLATEFKDALVFRKMSLGTCISIQKWAVELYKCSKRYDHFKTVFNFYIERLYGKEKFWFPAQSPTGFTKHFLLIQQKMEEWKNKNDYTIPHNEWDETISDMISEIEECLPDFPISGDKLKYALWELCDYMDMAVNILNEMDLPESSLICNVRDTCITRIQHWRRWFPLYIAMLKNLMEWSEWGHQLPRTKLNVNQTSPKGLKLIRQILEQITKTEKKVGFRLLRKFEQAVESH